MIGLFRQIFFVEIILNITSSFLSYSTFLKWWNVVLPQFNNLFSPKLPANIQFTSGTTGNPKAAALSHFNMINNAQSVIDISNKTFYEDPTQDHSLPMPLCEHTVWNCLVPLYHVFGFVGVSVLSTIIKCEMGKTNHLSSGHSCPRNSEALRLRVI